MINVALLAGSSALLAEALAAALVRRGRLQATEMPPILVAYAVAITTLLNPGLEKPPCQPNTKRQRNHGFSSSVQPVVSAVESSLRSLR